MTTSSERAERLARNEDLFREANERMADWEENDAANVEELYFCECADPECREKVRLRKAEYERIRSNPRRFFVVLGHDVPDVETVVETAETWAVIEKDPEVAHIVESDDPRDD